MKISATFIDEISHDIPHQNWGAKEWEQDFAHMKTMGIDTVVHIRAGYRKFISYPSAYLIETQQCFLPSQDLVGLFLRLSDQFNFDFYFGIYDSGVYWDTGDMSQEIEINKPVIQEVFATYGHHKSFKGWYISLELSRKTKGAITAIRDLGLYCKKVSGGLPVLISPWIDGEKAVIATEKKLKKPFRKFFGLLPLSQGNIYPVCAPISSPISPLSISTSFMNLSSTLQKPYAPRNEEKLNLDSTPCSRWFCVQYIGRFRSEEGCYCASRSLYGRVLDFAAACFPPQRR